MKRRARLKAKHKNGNGAGMPLSLAAEMWPTPCSTDHKGSAQLGQRRGQLSEAAEHWPTPRACDANGPQESPKRQGGAAATNWATPKVSTGAYQRSAGRIFMTLDGQAETFRSGLPDATTSTPGLESSPSRPASRRRLSPMFEEWLMGWPRGWTDIERSASAQSVMGRFRSWLRSHSAYLEALIDERR